MSEVILCNISDVREVILEAQAEWICSVLETIGVPLEVLDLIDNIQEYSSQLDYEYGIEIIYYANTEEVKIYKKQKYDSRKDPHKIKDPYEWLPAEEKHLIAYWKQPTYIRKAEGKKVYYEITLNEWSPKIKK